MTKDLSVKNQIIKHLTTNRTCRVADSVVAFVISFLKLNIFVN